MHNFEIDIFGEIVIPVISAPSKSILFDFKTELHKIHQDNYVNMLSITPTKIVRYTKNLNAKIKDYSSYWFAVGALADEWGLPIITEELKNSVKKEKNHFGIMSKKANNRVNTAIDWLVLLSKEKESLNHKFQTFYKWKLNFVTLTLSSKQIHPDSIIKSKLLNQFLIEIKKKYNTKHYFWRAESQANGNIHFHIVFDKFIPWQDCRDRWNRIQNKLGYVDNFNLKYGHSNPNSTDIHSLKKVENIAGYLSKYCSKNSKGIIILTKKKFKKRFFLMNKWNFPAPKAKFYRPINGKMWGLSNDLSKLGNCRVQQSDLHETQLRNFESINQKAVKIYDWVKIFRIDAKKLIEYNLSSIRETLHNYASKILYPEIQSIIPLKI